jgi:hypothetical protein
MIKYLGMFLVISGVFMIFYGVLFSTQIFLQEKEPPTVFKSEELSLGDLMPQGEEGRVALDSEVEIENILPITQMLNLFAATAFATLLIFGGAKIVNVGVFILK